MCGIVGIFSWKSTSPGIDVPLLEGMRDAMVHRGPDDAGVFISADRRVALGHRRLAIIDLSPAGRQPMSDESGKIWIVYNGELYNFRQLRTELERKGYRFRSDTDTEVLILLYKEHGKAMLHKLRGMFAFAIWDERTGELWLVRDRIGIKPLYYTSVPGSFLFASEIKALVKHPQVSPALDPTAFYHYLSFRTTPAPMTLFKDICKLPAGHALLVGADGQLKLEEYWDVLDAVTPLPAKSEDEYIEAILATLRDAVQCHMVSDVPIGVFLSGGVDSSANLALFSQLTSQPVQTFSIGYAKEARYNEFEYARRVAMMFQADYHELRIGPEELLSFLDEMVFHQDEPLADQVCVPLYYVAALARRHVTVCQVGEGSDELFGGYDYWRRLRRLQRFNRLMDGVLGPIRMAGLWAMAKTGHSTTKHYELLRRSAAREPLFWGGADAVPEALKHRLLGRRWNGMFRGYSSYEVIRPLYERFREKEALQGDLAWMTYVDLKLRLPELLLMRVDKMTMAISLEARVPFLDHQFVELVMSIPESSKIGTGQPKYLFKRAAERLLPHDVVYRRKQGFAIPLHEWSAGAIKTAIRETLYDFCRRTAALDWENVAAVLEGGRDTIAWTLFNFALWHAHWIEGRAVGRVLSLASGWPNRT